MGKRAESAPEGIVTSDGVRAGAILRTRLFIGLVSCVVILGLAAGGWYVWTQTSLLHKTAPKTKIDYSKLSPTQAVTAAKGQVATAETPTDKQEAYTALGDAYRSTGQTSQSTAAYQQALTYTSSGTSEVDNIQVLERLSSAYEDAGDTANAVSTLQKLISALQSSSISDKDFLLSRYQAELTYVQGGGN